MDNLNQMQSNAMNSVPGLADLDKTDLSQILKIFQKYNLKVSYELICWVCCTNSNFLFIQMSNKRSPKRYLKKS